MDYILLLLPPPTPILCILFVGMSNMNGMYLDKKYDSLPGFNLWMNHSDFFFSNHHPYQLT